MIYHPEFAAKKSSNALFLELFVFSVFCVLFLALLAFIGIFGFFG